MRNFFGNIFPFLKKKGSFKSNAPSFYVQGGINSPSCFSQGISSSSPSSYCDNSIILYNIINRAIFYIIGSGLTPFFHNTSREQFFNSKRIDVSWKSFSRDAFLGKIEDLFLMQRVIIGECLKNNECFVVIVEDEKFPFKFKLKLFSSSDLQRFSLRDLKTGYIKDGIEYNKKFEKVAFHFKSFNGMALKNTLRIPVSSVFHVISPPIDLNFSFNVYKESKSHIFTLQDILRSVSYKKYINSKIAFKVKGSSGFTFDDCVIPDTSSVSSSSIYADNISGDAEGLSVSSHPSRVEGAQGEGVNFSPPPPSSSSRKMEKKMFTDINIDDGAILFFDDTKDVESVTDDPEASKIQPFIDSIVGIVSQSLGVSGDDVTSNLSDVNFSSAKASLAKNSMIHEGIRNSFIRSFMDKLMTLFLSKNFPSLALSTSFSWKTPGEIVLDPTKNINAKISMLKAGIISYEDIAKDRGFSSYEDYLERIKENKRDEKERGLSSFEGEWRGIDNDDYKKDENKED